MVGIVNEPLLMHCFDQLIELRLMDSSLSLGYPKDHEGADARLLGEIEAGGAEEAADSDLVRESGVRSVVGWG